MNFSSSVRQFHRWMSIVFTAFVIFVFAMNMKSEPPAEWVYFLPLPPLALMLISGLYLFALPYLSKARV
jgi:ABC-type polysaccharide/polyol phosphate export permease